MRNLRRKEKMIQKVKLKRLTVRQRFAAGCLLLLGAVAITSFGFVIVKSN
jgi:hypothetical protein